MSRKPSVVAILTNATTTVTGSYHEPWGDENTFHASGSTVSGTGSATIVIEVSDDLNYAWITMGTITLTLGVTATADGLSKIVPWKYARARVSAISGTGASVSVSMGSLA